MRQPECQRFRQRKVRLPVQTTRPPRHHLPSKYPLPHLSLRAWGQPLRHRCQLRVPKNQSLLPTGLLIPRTTVILLFPTIRNRIPKRKTPLYRVPSLVHRLLSSLCLRLPLVLILLLMLLALRLRVRWCWTEEGCRRPPLLVLSWAPVACVSWASCLRGACSVATKRKPTPRSERVSPLPIICSASSSCSCVTVLCDARHLFLGITTSSKDISIYT
jgi:hypothetical protein